VSTMSPLSPLVIVLALGVVLAVFDLWNWP
jgi:hypothetical protein